MKIHSLVGIDGYILAIYLQDDRAFSFSIIDRFGKAHTCKSSFRSVDNATLLAMSAINWERESPK